MPVTHVRVLGGGNTYCMIGLNNGVKVGFNATVNDQPGRAVGQETEIQPIGSKYPIEIATPYAMGAGTLTISVYQTWGEDSWVSAFMYDNGQDFGDENPWKGYNTAHGQETGRPVDLVEVMDAQRKLNHNIVVKTVELGADGTEARINTYQGCVISNIQQDNNIRNDTMTGQGTITFRYTHVVKTRL